MNRTVIAGSVIAILAILVLTGSLVLRTRSQPADQETARLSPDRFANLPSAIVDTLESLGCAVPQTFGNPEPDNVIKGRFVSTANADWAVLCAHDRGSVILVFPNGSADSMVELEPSPDVQWLQESGGRMEFSRAIAVADPQYIVEHYKAFGGPEPPPLDHDGINDIFVGKGSVVFYWHDGRWLQLQGAD